MFSEDEQQQSEHSRRHKMNNRMGAGSNGATAAPSVQNSRTKQSNGMIKQKNILSIKEICTIARSNLVGGGLF